MNKTRGQWPGFFTVYSFMGIHFIYAMNKE